MLGFLKGLIPQLRQLPIAGGSGDMASQLRRLPIAGYQGSHLRNSLYRGAPFNPSHLRNLPYSGPPADLSHLRNLPYSGPPADLSQMRPLVYRPDVDGFHSNDLLYRPDVHRTNVLPLNMPMGNHILQTTQPHQIPQNVSPSDPYFGYGDQFKWQNPADGANPRMLGSTRIFPEGHIYDSMPPSYNENPGYWQDREQRGLGMGQRLYQNDQQYWDDKYAEDMRQNRVPTIIERVDRSKPMVPGQKYKTHARYQTKEEWMGDYGSNWFGVQEAVKQRAAMRWLLDQHRINQGLAPNDWEAVKREKLANADRARERERAWLASQRR